MSVLESGPLTQVREKNNIAVVLTLQTVNRKAVHMNIITCTGMFLTA